MNLKYKNIAISGGAATGKGTLREGLRPYLEPLGFSFRSGGDIQREFMKERTNPKASLAGDEFAKALDSKTAELLENGHLVVESWLAGFIARDRTDTLKVFVYCSNDSIRIDRIVNRDHVNVQQAKEVIFDRQNDNFLVWKKLYGEYDFWNPSYFDIMIDTYSLNRDEVVQKVLDAIGYKSQ